jgi:hypothetical protein
MRGFDREVNTNDDERNSDDDRPRESSVLYFVFFKCVLSDSDDLLHFALEVMIDRRFILRAPFPLPFRLI